MYCERTGSVSSSPPSEYDCQSTNTAAQRPASGMRLEPLGQQRCGRLRVGVEVDDEEVADVVPRRRGHQAGATVGRARNGVALQGHTASFVRRGWQRRSEHLEALALGVDRRLVEAEVGARRQRAPGVRREAVVGPAARLVVGLQLLHVAVQLDEALLLDDPHVGGDVAADAVARRAPAEPAAVAAEVVERDAHLADVDDVEGEVVEVGLALVDERHHVVVGVDVEPDAVLAEPVGELHARDPRCRSGTAPRSRRSGS